MREEQLFYMDQREDGATLNQRSKTETDSYNLANGLFFIIKHSIVEKCLVLVYMKMCPGTRFQGVSA